MPRSTRASSAKLERPRAPRSAAGPPPSAPHPGDSDMNSAVRSVLVAALAAAPAAAPANVQGQGVAAPPVAERVPHADTTLGDIRQDPYHWLRDRTDARRIAHLEHEN